MRTDDFDYLLPDDLIAQVPTADRTASRLLVLHRVSRRLEMTRFARLGDFLNPGDLLVLNDSRVVPARLRGQKIHGGGSLEILLLEPHEDSGWWVMLRPGKRVRTGTPLIFPFATEKLEATVQAKDESGRYRLSFPPGVDVLAFAERRGEVPLPPYISRSAPLASDRDRYQTVYARTPGSVAAPTAGLHFTHDFLDALRKFGVETCSVTLHVGLGTFAPVKTDRPEEHVMHAEAYEVPPAAAMAIERARQDGRRVIAVGTTSLRVVESVARANRGRVREGKGWTRLFVIPPSDFLVVEGLLTNFHLPRSTLLMLVSAFAGPGSTEGRDLVLQAYREAIASRFRFFSYGDAMLLV